MYKDTKLAERPWPYRDREPEAPKILRLSSVLQQLGLRRSTAYLRIQQGVLVPPVRTGPRTVGWLSDEINAQYAAFAAGLDEDAVRALVGSLIAKRLT